MQKSMFLLLALLLPTFGQASTNEAFLDRAALQKWLDSDIPRGNGFYVRNTIPKGNSMKFCAGAGCKIKLPYSFTEAQIREVAKVMELARRDRNCTANTAACERVALQYGVRAMDKMVRDTKLRQLSMAEMVRHSINRENNNEPANWSLQLSKGQQLLRDCVDQAANGSSYLIILASNGLVKLHKVIEPGQTNFGPFPHFFTRIRETSGQKGTYDFDLYREPRTDFDKLARVARRQ